MLRYLSAIEFHHNLFTCDLYNFLSISLNLLEKILNNLLDKMRFNEITHCRLISSQYLIRLYRIFILSSLLQLCHT